MTYENAVDKMVEAETEGPEDVEVSLILGQRTPLDSIRSNSSSMSQRDLQMLLDKSE